MRRTLRFGLVGIASGVLILVVPTSSAWAGSHFTGSAPGSATCLFSITVAFSPPLTNSGGGTNTHATGKAGLCTASGSAYSPDISFKRTQKVQMNSGNTATPFLTSPGLCGGSTHPGGNFSVRWKGNFNGVYLGAPLSGTASFNPSDISTGGAQIDTSSGKVGLDLL